MSSYNPNIRPFPQEWLRTSDKENRDKVSTYFRKARKKVTSDQIRDIVAVENYIAIGNYPEIVERLDEIFKTGASREDAIFQIIQEGIQKKSEFTDPEWVKSVMDLHTDIGNPGIWGIISFCGKALIVLSIIGGIIIAYALNRYDGGIALGITLMIQGIVYGILIIGFSVLGTTVEKIEKKLAVKK